ncbi:hypothetical protein GUITHDRAFT_122615 [Guillardia theta CCMP2712]|uniref:Uncharacterized protein n=1 Tax=Guillardia theta (strain CCMP2712) TaxID=905079 RepID=L1I4H1_GUITC|nr:hypothetical protein GUITHDRAFT_122615 [Guillardia theta CCMP2712]EKX31178.1 hypothetical protein GUITHDRAFT_122615 [Guillardia theta CCMP2712]|eukprot:XP_005818158.1 hypothetical protein GUITHDRAFT_122615 [Guillardia theta CCMP2712]
MIASSASIAPQNQQLAELYKALEMFKNNPTTQALGGPGGASFMRLLEQLERDGIVKRHFGDVPKRLGGVCGWTVFDDKMEEWSKRRQAWFMEGKEGKTYKPNSLFQILRRLGFFPTESTKRASHGLDFEGSRTFAWDGSRHVKYVQSKAEQERNGRLFRGDKDVPVTEISDNNQKQTLPSIAKIEHESLMPSISANGISHKSDIQTADVKPGQAFDWSLGLQSNFNPANQASTMISQQILQLLQQQQHQQQQQHLFLLSQQQQQQQYNHLLNGQGRIRIAALAPKAVDQWMPATQLPSFETSLQ